MVLIGARDAGRGREAAQGLHSEGISAYFIRLDVTRQETIDQAARQFGPKSPLVVMTSLCLIGARNDRFFMW
jgi:NAD(P)-dependent dehydrogenase (short-subunit alcohol dehydrogenase family)